MTWNRAITERVLGADTELSRAMARLIATATVIAGRDPRDVGAALVRAFVVHTRDNPRHADRMIDAAIRALLDEYEIHAGGAS